MDAQDFVAVNPYGPNAVKPFVGVSKLNLRVDLPLALTACTIQNYRVYYALQHVFQIPYKSA